MFHVGIAETIILVPYFLPPRLTGAVENYFYETSFHNCCKMWILRLGFIYGSCMMVLHHIFAAGLFLNVVSGTTERTSWANGMGYSLPLI
jgi:hypothetical protein